MICILVVPELEMLQLVLIFTIAMETEIFSGGGRLGWEPEQKVSRFACCQ
jgi:hypothetical protein